MMWHVLGKVLLVRSELLVLGKENIIGWGEVERVGWDN